MVEVHFAHGAVFTLGAYLTYALTGSQFGINGLLANAAVPVRLPFPAALVVGSLLAGVAAETSAVMLAYLDEACKQRQAAGQLHTLQDLLQTVHTGAVERIRPMAMAGLAMLKLR